MNTITLSQLVLTVQDVARTAKFYEAVLGMAPITFGAAQVGLQFGSQTILLQPAHDPARLAAANPTPGSASLCLMTETPLLGVEYVLARLNVEIVAGPLPRTGPDGPLMSVYIRDPDGNLIEIANRR